MAYEIIYPKLYRLYKSRGQIIAYYVLPPTNLCTYPNCITWLQGCVLMTSCPRSSMHSRHHTSVWVSYFVRMN